MQSDFSTKRIQVNGITLHVIDEGKGDPVLLLHGFPDSSLLWRYQIPALVAGGFRVLAPDQRGFGQSDRPQGVEHYQFEYLLSDALGVLDQARIERAHVVGHDWGASVAWGLASFAPGRVARLVALSVSHPATYYGPLSQYEKSWYALLFQFEGIAEQAWRKDDWRLMREWLGSAKDTETYIQDLERPGALTAGLNWYRANDSPASMFGLGESIAWPAVQAPTLGVWSAGDRYCGEHGFVDPQNHIAGPYRYERIEQASHWIPLDQPERLNRLLLEFFRSPM